MLVVIALGSTVSGNTRTFVHVMFITVISRQTVVLGRSWSKNRFIVVAMKMVSDTRKLWRPLICWDITDYIGTMTTVGFIR